MLAWVGRSIAKAIARDLSCRLLPAERELLEQVRLQRIDDRASLAVPILVGLHELGERPQRRRGLRIALVVWVFDGLGITPLGLRTEIDAQLRNGGPPRSD